MNAQKIIKNFRPQIDEELDVIRKQQHQMAQKHKKSKSHSDMYINILLDSGISYIGKVILFNNSNSPNCKVFIKSNNVKELRIGVNVNMDLSNTNRFSDLQSAMNDYLESLLEEAILDFPDWMEKHSIKSNETNPIFNLDEIREEFKYKKIRFGVWRIAYAFSFFDNAKPQLAKFNKIVHLGLSEAELPN